MSKDLTGKTVAILVTDGFEQSEYTEPKKALEEAGAKTVTVSLKGGEVKGWQHTNWGDSFKVDQEISTANANDFDAIVLPGGVMSPDKLRNCEKTVAFVKQFVDTGKPIAAICHGPWTLINAGGAKGRKMTSYSSIRVDLENAGAQWVDAAVVTDRGLVTSRCPDDLPDFNRKMIEEISEGIHQRKAA